MALPKISISFMNGQLGVVADSQDGLVALVCGAEAVASSFALHTAYTLYRPSGLDALGVTEENNPGLCKVVREFYQEAPEGTRAVLFGGRVRLCGRNVGDIRRFGFVLPFAVLLQKSEQQAEREQQHRACRAAPEGDHPHKDPDENTGDDQRRRADRERDAQCFEHVFAPFRFCPL